MTWVRIDENFARHPKVVQAGPLGMAMQIAALCYSNQHLTNGYIPKAVAATLLDFEGLAITPPCDDEDLASPGWDVEWPLVVEDMVRVGLWKPVQGGWQIHDYEDYQPSKKTIEARREAGKKGGKHKPLQYDKQKAKQNASKPSKKGQAGPVPVTVPLREEGITQEGNPSAARAKKSPSKPKGKDDALQAVELWNEIAASGPVVPEVQPPLNRDRLKKLPLRLAELGGLEGWRIMCFKVKNSLILTGQKTDWNGATFDWVLSPTNLTKIMEGNYDDTGPGTAAGYQATADAVAEGARIARERKEQKRGLVVHDGGRSRDKDPG